MKIRSHTIRFLFAATAIGTLASFADAGPGAQNWTRTRPVTTTEEAAALKPDDTVVMACGACKTIMLHEAKRIGPRSKGQTEWYTTGSKHECGHCGGEITVVKGKTENSMQHNCSKCGEGAATCCVAAADES